MTDEQRKELEKLRKKRGKIIERIKYLEALELRTFPACQWCGYQHRGACLPG